MKVTAEYRPIESKKYIGIASITIDRALIINDIKVYRNCYDIRLVFPVNEKTRLKGKKNIVVKNSDTWYLIKAAIIHAISTCTGKSSITGARDCETGAEGENHE